MLLAINVSTYPLVAATVDPKSGVKSGVLRLVIELLPIDKSPDITSDPFNGKNPGPIHVENGTAEPPWSKPNRLSIYPRTALCTGTVSAALLVNEESDENSFTTTPRLNPKPSIFDNEILALNVTVPVPWSTEKNRPTLNIPSWLVET